MPGIKGSKVLSLSLSAAMMVSMLGLAGCGDRDNGNRNVRTNSVRDGVNGGMEGGLNRYGVLSNGTDGTNLRGEGAGMTHNMRVDRRLSQRISEMTDVDTAHVVIDGRNAYVAVTTPGSKSKANTYGAKSFGANERTRDMGGTRVHGMTGTRAPYTTSGTAPGITGNGTRDLPSRVTDNGPSDRDRGLYGTLGTGSYGMVRGLTNATRDVGRGVGDIARGAGDVVRGTGNTLERGAENLTGRTTAPTHNMAPSNRTAPSSNVVGSPNDTLPSALKHKISNKVKQYAPSVERVYISTHPEFVNRLSTYSNGNGSMINEAGSDFTNFMDRIFPGSRQSLTGRPANPAGYGPMNGTTNNTGRNGSMTAPSGMQR
ncbi:hypothetical protein Q5741_11070 [Paenibacillus sp. JX-17]|uniref:Sporulation protein n=1 Tax=Paenibacillus lacisoli TaxID=3064525 RepID=A0ABT9CH17_9BACL|nr:YhcN/YlaJ family sporulation lipoprotein [Paenibacillus sp. JX-17]MDO7906956.1 hypothetical protein [Paenibacillus sp. JX-17]